MKFWSLAGSVSLVLMITCGITLADGPAVRVASATVRTAVLEQPAPATLDDLLSANPIRQTGFHHGPACGVEPYPAPISANVGGYGPRCGCDVAAAPSCGCDVAGCASCGGCCPKRHHSILDLLGLGCCKRACGTPCCGTPTCGCDLAPACGCDVAPACASGCATPCAVGPACGCDVAPACSSCCGGGHHRGGLLGFLKGHHGCGQGCCHQAPACGCDVAPACGCDVAPSCGCDVGCASSCGSGCCGHRPRGLLACLFGGCGHHQTSCCSAPACCSAPTCCSAPACGCDLAPVCASPRVAPAPVMNMPQAVPYYAPPVPTATAPAPVALPAAVTVDPAVRANVPPAPPVSADVHGGIKAPAWVPVQ